MLLTTKARERMWREEKKNKKEKEKEKKKNKEKEGEKSGFGSRPDDH